MTSTPLDPSALLQGLHGAGVEHVLIGGLAVIAHGGRRLTNDVDICPAPDRENLGRLASLLDQLDARQLGVGDFEAHEFPFDPRKPEELSEGGNFRLVTRDGVLDIMQWIPGMPGDNAYPELAGDALEGDVFGVPVRVCSLDHLRRMKRAADRPQDRQDLADLAAAHGEEDG